MYLLTRFKLYIMKNKRFFKTSKMKKNCAFEYRILIYLGYDEAPDTGAVEVDYNMSKFYLISLEGPRVSIQ